MNNRADLSRILECTKKIESALEKNYGAIGRGLGEKAISVKHIIGDSLCRKILFLSTIRNKVFHEDDYQINQLTTSSFFLVCKECKQSLNIPLNENSTAYDSRDDTGKNLNTANLKDWKAIKHNQKKVHGKMAASIIPIAVIILFLLMFFR